MRLAGVRLNHRGFSRVTPLEGLRNLTSQQAVSHPKKVMEEKIILVTPYAIFPRDNPAKLKDYLEFREKVLKKA